MTEKTGKIIFIAVTVVVVATVAGVNAWMNRTPESIVRERARTDAVAVRFELAIASADDEAAAVRERYERRVSEDVEQIEKAVASMDIVDIGERLRPFILGTGSSGR